MLVSPSFRKDLDGFVLPRRYLDAVVWLEASCAERHVKFSFYATVIWSRCASSECVYTKKYF